MRTRIEEAVITPQPAGYDLHRNQESAAEQARIEEPVITASSSLQGIRLQKRRKIQLNGPYQRKVIPLQPERYDYIGKKLQLNRPA